MGLNNLKYFILLTFFIITSCDSEIKEDVINKEKMVKILIDMHLAEEAIENLSYDKDTRSSFCKERARDFRQVFNIRGAL